jgi:hypothetical protein
MEVQKGRGNLEGIGVFGRIILKWFSEVKWLRNNQQDATL